MLAEIGQRWKAAMSYVITTPDLLASAASDVVGIGSSLRAAHAARYRRRSRRCSLRTANRDTAGTASKPRPAPQIRRFL